MTREERRIKRNEMFLHLAYDGIPRWRAYIIASLLCRRWGNR